LRYHDECECVRVSCNHLDERLPSVIADLKSTSREPLREFCKHLLSFNPNVTIYRADDRDETQMRSSFEGGGVLLDLLRGLDCRLQSRAGDDGTVEADSFRGFMKVVVSNVPVRWAEA
jgi:hypothetical protein